MRVMSLAKKKSILDSIVDKKKFSSLSPQHKIKPRMSSAVKEFMESEAYSVLMSKQKTVVENDNEEESVKKSEYALFLLLLTHY